MMMMMVMMMMVMVMTMMTNSQDSLIIPKTDSLPGQVHT